MGSMREQIVAAIVDRLTTGQKPAGLTVHRYQLRPLENDDLPSLCVYWSACEPAEKFFVAAPCQDLLTEYVLTVRLDVRAIGDPVDAAIDDFVQYARAVIFMDPSLGGLALGIREGVLHVDGEERNKSYASGTLELDIAYLEEPYPYAETPLGGPIKRLDFVQPSTEPGTATLIVEDTTP